MRECIIEDVVALTKDIPELAIYRGTKGIVRSIWFAPTVAYEVEFVSGGTAVRALVMAENLVAMNDVCPPTSAGIVFGP